MSKPTEKLEAIFEAALALETDAQRADYLSLACPEPKLRREVEALLAAHAKPDTIFEDKTRRIEMNPSEAVGTVIGRYKLLEALGEGGFGSVWLAEQKEPVRRKVALKVIKLGMDTKQVVARFEAERQALALMDHPNIAKVLEAGTTEQGRPYFVMELVRGIPITKFCDENKLATRERLDLFIKVCHAVQHAHQKGIIHRDLKPSNVLVTLHDGVPVPKVIDFGIAKATQQELTDKTIHTQFQQFIGTPAYVSPEQAEMSGLDLDTRSDIYSLGVLLYELLTGVTPFDGHRLAQSGLDEMRRIIREDEPQRPSTRLSTLELAAATTLAKHRKEKLPALVNLVRGDLDWIVMKCLEKDRTRRYETANGLAADLQRHLTHEPIVARPPSAAYRFRKACRRNRIAFTAAACVLAALVIALIGIWVSAQRARRAQVHESIQRNLAEQRQRQAETAQQLAEANERKARTEAEKSAQAAKFIQSILSGMDEAAAQGQSQTLLFELLMRALRRAETELTNQVEVQIEVISAISQCTDRLGRADYAYEVANRALVLGRARFGEDAPRTAELMTLAATRAARFDRMAAAESLASRALTILRRAHGTKHPATLAPLRELGNVFASTGRPSEAEPLLREHLSAAGGVLDADDEAHWTSRIALARALSELNRHAEAEPLLREAAAGYERTIGATSRRSSHATHQLCENLIRQGKLAEAEAVARSLVDHLHGLQVEHYGAVQMSLLLGKILTDLGRDADAGNALHEAFDMSRRTFGSRSTVTRDAMNALDACYRKQGRVADAEGLKRQLAERPPAPASGGAAAFLKSTLNLEAKLRTDNTDAQSAVSLAARQAWLGRTNDWRATSRRIIECLADTSHPPSIERAAKSAVFVPGADRDLIDKAGVLARRALDLSAESMLLPFFQITAAMVEYRRGNLTAADALLAQVKDDDSFRGIKVALFYRAMIAARQSRVDDARQFLAAGEAGMLPLPADESAPLDSGATHDDLILWLACKEARAMIDGQP